MTLNGVDIYYGTKNPPEWQIAIFLLVVFLPAFMVMVVRGTAALHSETSK